MTSRSSACAPGGELMVMETGGPGAQLTGGRAAEITSGRTQRRPWFPVGDVGRAVECISEDR